MVRSVQTAHLIKISTISKRTKTSFSLEPCHLEVLSGASNMISEPMVFMVQTVPLYCTDTNTISKWTETRFHMTHSPRSMIGMPKTISEPMVRFVQIVHLSCTCIAPALTLSPNRPEQDSTWPTSPRTFHLVRSKHFLCLCSVWRK
jgi:hypothetical protein